MTDGKATSRKQEIPLACDMSALTAEQRERQRVLSRRLREDALEIGELEDGYAFAHSPDGEALAAMAEFVANERLCCPFFGFAITVGRDGGPAWLRITGEGEAKHVLEAEMGLSA
jgi:hypothetical protein